jgi:hypothetical protein
MNSDEAKQALRLYLLNTHSGVNEALNRIEALTAALGQTLPAFAEEYSRQSAILAERRVEQARLTAGGSIHSADHLIDAIEYLIQNRS